MKIVPLTQARAQLSKIVKQAANTRERFEITRRGSRAAVLIGADDYDSMVETLAVLSDVKLAKDTRDGLEDLAEGRVFSTAKVRDAIDPRG